MLFRSPTRDFPPDPAGGEGFDNTGEALGMSPSLLKKYLAAAQTVSEHMVLKTHGITFAPFPVTSYNEQKKLTEQAIIDFYQRHAVRVADYLEAAWRYRHRGPEESGIDPATWAERHHLSSRYFALVWETLSDASRAANDFANAAPDRAGKTIGFYEQLGQMWNALPAPTDARTKPPEWNGLERYVEFWQRKLPHREGAMIQSHAGNWPIGHLEFRAREAAARDQFDPGNLRPKVAITVARLPAARDKAFSENGATLHLVVRRAYDPSVENATSGSDSPSPSVVVRNAIFSKSNNAPRNDEERQKQEVVTLRTVLEQHAPALAERLAFGKKSGGGEIDADSFVISVP